MNETVNKHGVLRFGSIHRHRKAPLAEIFEGFCRGQATFQRRSGQEAKWIKEHETDYTPSRRRQQQTRCHQH